MLDIEKLMREGKSLSEIGDLVTEEMNKVQAKLDKEQEAQAAAAQLEEKRSKAKAKAVKALKDYLNLTVGDVSEKDAEDQVDSALISVRFVRKLESGKHVSLFDVFNTLG
jgi:FKBP-type peptidyl-prolyl cis-trans isomerase